MIGGVLGAETLFIENNEDKVTNQEFFLPRKELDL